MHGRDSGKQNNLPKWLRHSLYIPSSAKDKTGCWGQCLGNSKRRKAIDKEMEKQMFGIHGTQSIL